MDCQKLFSVIDGMNDQYCDIWEAVCNIESPTAYKAGVDAAGQFFINMARQRGWHVDVLEDEKAGNAVSITLNPEAQAQPVVFSGHIDTVHPVGSFGVPAVRRDDAYIYGPGVLDCKGGVVASFMAMDALYRCGFTARPVRLIIQSDEETGSKTSNLRTVEYMCEKAKNAVAFLNTEATKENSAVLIRKGILRYSYKVTGKAAHSARCNQGANAIAEAAHKILKLEKLKDDQGITCNCGVIQGGTVANTVAEQCVFTADFRFSSQKEYLKAEELAREVAESFEIQGCCCELEKVSYRPAMPLTDRNVALLERMNKIYARVGLPQLRAVSSKGGSDAAYITQAGIPCVDNLGVEGKNLHNPGEYARLDSLAASAKRLAAVAACI